MSLAICEREWYPSQCITGQLVSELMSWLNASLLITVQLNGFVCISRDWETSGIQTVMSTAQWYGTRPYKGLAKGWWVSKVGNMCNPFNLKDD